MAVPKVEHLDSSKAGHSADRLVVWATMTAAQMAEHLDPSSAVH